MKAIAVVLLALLTGCTSLRESAHGAIGFDAATTAIGVGSGVAVEANPLIGSPLAFAGLLVARVVGVEVVNGWDEPKRTETLSALNSVWWGIGISNLLVIVAASNPVGLAFGTLAGLGWWASTSDQRLFAQACAAERERIAKPQMPCIFNGAPI